MRDGFVTSVPLRSAFDGFRYDLLGRDGQRHDLDERVALARVRLELFLTPRSA